MTPEDLAAIREESEIEHAPDVCYEDWRRHVMGLLEHIDSQADEIKQANHRYADLQNICDDQDKEIKRLEDALVEERSQWNAVCRDIGADPTDRYCTSEDDYPEARQQLRAEGVIR